VGTAKRERKKQNRQIRLQELEKQRRRQKTKRRGLQLCIIIPLAVAALIGIVVAVSGKSKSSSTATTAASATSDTTAVSDTAAATATTAGVPTTTLAPLPCPAADGSSPQTRSFPSPPATCIDPTKVYEATVTTNKGTFTMDLDPGLAPKTVNNFVYLAGYHFFDNTKCHRIIPGFVVQCGDPTGQGNGGPGYSFADELPAQGAYHLGSVAMANAGPNTNGSQFFIVTGSSGTSLPPMYSLFGSVSSGYDSTVKAMEAAGSSSGTPTSDVIIDKVTVAVKTGVSASPTTTAPAPTTAN
jgi:cyclophilin family peptidyl-prolyl cis-trans isomerase